MASKRLRRASADQGEELQVDMSPMIDMAFLLLIFFLVTAVARVVEQDKKISIATAPNSTKQETANGRIVINVYEDGLFAGETGLEKSALPDNETITQYLRDRKDAFTLYQPILHVRADQNADFYKVRQLIRIAASLGINDVRFASYVTDK